MRGAFRRKGFGNYPKAELLVLQSNFAVADQCLEEIRSCLIEETKMCPPRYVADDLDSGFPHLGGCGHRGYLPNFILENWLNRVPSRTELQDCSVDSAGTTSGMERPTAPWLTSPGSRQSWIAQTAFRRETSYRRNLSARKQECRLGMRTPSATPHAGTAVSRHSVYRTGQFPDCRQLSRKQTRKSFVSCHH